MGLRAREPWWYNTGTTAVINVGSTNTYLDVMDWVLGGVNACIEGNEKPDPKDDAGVVPSDATTALMEGITRSVPRASNLREQEATTLSHGSVVLITELKLPFLLILETERRIFQVARKALF